MDYTFSTPALGVPVLADTEFRARLKRGFDVAGGNGSSGGAHVFGYILRGTPMGRRIADSLAIPYGIARNSTVDDGTQRINFPAGSLANRLFYVGDVVCVIDTTAAWVTTAVVARNVTGVDPAGLWIDVDGAALADATESGHVIANQALVTHGGASSPVTVLAPPEGVLVGADVKTFTIPTDLQANGQLTPAIRNSPVAWGSIIRGDRVPGMLVAGPTTTTEALLSPARIPGPMLTALIGIPPAGPGGVIKFPELTFERFDLNSV